MAYRRTVAVSLKSFDVSLEPSRVAVCTGVGSLCFPAFASYPGRYYLDSAIGQICIRKTRDLVRARNVRSASLSRSLTRAASPLSLLISSVMVPSGPARCRGSSSARLCDRCKGFRLGRDVCPDLCSSYVGTLRAIENARQGLRLVFPVGLFSASRENTSATFEAAVVQ